MSLDKAVLFNLLKNFDEEAKEKITLVAVGGTAMTLLDLKVSTLDIDFTVPRSDKTEFESSKLSTSWIQNRCLCRWIGVLQYPAG